MISELVRILLEANTPHDVIVAAVRAMEDKQRYIPELTARQLRNQRHYDNRRLKSVLKASEPSYSDDMVAPLNPPLDGGLSLSPAPLSLSNLNPPLNPPTQKKLSARKVFVLPTWMQETERFRLAWFGFEEMRNKIKKPMTDNAKHLAIGKLERFKAMGHDPTEILNQSIMNDYQDLYEPKGNNNAKHSGNITPTKTDRLKAAALRAAEAGGFAPPRQPGQASPDYDALSVFPFP